MQELLERTPATGAAGSPVDPAQLRSLLEGDERLARVELRRQIGRLERELGELFTSAFPRTRIEWGVRPAGGPRLLGIGELEQVRDELASRIAEVRGILGDCAYVETRNRELLEQMIAEPGKFKWLRISNEDIGEQGCRHWHSRPRFGPLGMLMNWWRVKLSSGCPLSPGRRSAASRKEVARSKRRKRRRRPPAEHQAPKPPEPAESPAPTRQAARRRAAGDERPPAPWGSFPLQELTVLVALVMLVIGFVSYSPVTIAVGVVLGCLGGLELSVREHFGGYRSHTVLLAGTAFVLTVTSLLYVGGLVPLICLGAGVAVFAAAFFALRSAFRRASGGLSFRVGSAGG